MRWSRRTVRRAASLMFVVAAWGAGDADAPSLVQRVEVRVVWDDGVFERSAERVTFAFDTEAAQALTGGLEMGGAEMPPGAVR